MGSSNQSDLVRKIQIKLREGAGVPEYDPADPAFRFRPLRVETFIGGLGFNATQFPDFISFNTTEAYRRLLRSLDLNGSEIVSTKAKQENLRKVETVENDMALSDFLNIELKCQTEVDEEPKIKSANESAQSTHILNVSGIDLDDYFSDTKKENESTVKNVDLVEKPSSLEKSLFPVESKKIDPFDLIADSNASTVDPFQMGFTENFPIVTEEEHMTTLGQIQSASDTWPQDDLWPPTSSIMPVNASQLEAKDDLFDDWQDFSSSRNARDSEISSARTPEKSEEVNFGGFFQFDEDPSIGNVMHQPDLFPEGMNGSDETRKAQHSKATVDELLSEMHDLSFMLEDGLSVLGEPRPSSQAS
ncbi:uncharacterized protein LOC144709337 [Wolffia australiana]